MRISNIRITIVKLNISTCISMSYEGNVWRTAWIQLWFWAMWNFNILDNIILCWIQFHPINYFINNHAAFAFILECPDHGEASSGGGTVGPGVAVPPGLNIKQSQNDQGIQLTKSVTKPFLAWENSRHFATPSLVSPRNDIWKKECNNFVLMTLHYPDLDLSPPQRPHCVVIVGRRAEHHRPPHAFFFFSLIAIFIGIPSGSLCGGERIWIVLLIGRAAWEICFNNQKQYPDLVSDTSSIWNFYARSSDVISHGNLWWRREKYRLFSQASCWDHGKHSF